MHTSDVNALSAWLLFSADVRDRAMAGATELSTRELSALVLVSNHAGRGIDWLHRRLGITQSGCVRLVDRLEGLGLVRREKVPGRREVALSLTEAGKRRLRDGLRAREAATASLLSPLTAPERTQMVRLIEKLLAAGSRLRADADVVCRLCDWDACRPHCPVDASVIGGDAGSR